ncbi:hypothetical protein [Oceanobacillus sp. 1P07AA]|uniref:hypothetical protein n=1 Tax=Oceanobacillus sp. 1P07AA TaxID=3132293 RepID=UPI0039A4C334
MSKTNIVVNTDGKIVNMAVAGQMTMEDSKKFVDDYHNKISPLNGAEYDLIVDCTDMRVLTKDMTDNLVEVMKMYKETGFKHITYTVSDNITLKMQLSRLTGNAGLKDITKVETI